MIMKSNSNNSTIHGNVPKIHHHKYHGNYYCADGPGVSPNMKLTQFFSDKIFPRHLQMFLVNSHTFHWQLPKFVTKLTCLIFPPCWVVLLV